MNEQLAFQRFLAHKLTEIRIKTPSYSLRAFARRAGLTPSALSEILNGKRRVSKEMAQKVAKKLCLDPDQVVALLGGFPQKLRRKNSEAAQSIEYTQLNMDHFRVISDWYHFAILSLSETEDYRHEAEWIGARLNVKSTDVTTALDRLERLGMLELDEAGKPVRGAPRYITSDDIADLSLRKVHSQNLELARESLENDGVLERDFTAVSMAVDPAKMPEAKKMIREFRDRLCSFMESGKKTEVHKLCVQLIPLTKSLKKEEGKVV